MRLLITVVLGLVAVLTLHGQVTTVIPLSPGSYAVTFPSGKVSLVTVQSMGGDFYSLWDGSHLVQVHVAALSANTYYLTDTSGQSMTVTMLPKPAQRDVNVPPPAQPNYTIQQQQPPNLVGMYAQMVAICNSRGGLIYKGKCVTPQQAQAMSVNEQAKRDTKENAKLKDKAANSCRKLGGTLDSNLVCKDKDGNVLTKK